MSKGGRRPQRTCLGCGARDDQVKLIRLTVANARDLKTDNRSGRGGYLHRVQGCWQIFLKKKSAWRAFHVEISKEAKEKLVQKLMEQHWE